MISFLPPGLHLIVVHSAMNSSSIEPLKKLRLSGSHYLSILL
jgi:hypothetical protein